VPFRHIERAISCSASSSGPTRSWSWSSPAAGRRQRQPTHDSTVVGRRHRNCWH